MITGLLSEAPTLRQLVRTMPKPVPYPQLVWQAVELGYRPPDVSTAVREGACNAPSWAKQASRRDPSSCHYLLDGMVRPYSEEYDCRKNPSCAGEYVTRKHNLNGRYLVLLPCNGGALIGDYFSRPTWRNAAKWFPERMTFLDFAAVDSITTVLSNDNGGLIVFENEMDRVLGYDLAPVFSPEKKQACKQGLERSRPRLESYERVFALLNVRLYDETMRESGLSNIEFIDTQYKQGAFGANLPVLRQRFEETVL